MESNLTNVGLNELLQFCSNSSTTYVGQTANTIFWVEGIFLSITSLIGILGNILTIIILNKIRLDNVFNQVCPWSHLKRNERMPIIYLLQLIMMLCIADSLFAGVSFIEYGLRKGLKLISYTTPIYVQMWPKLIYPVHALSYTQSLLIKLAISIERWLVITV